MRSLRIRLWTQKASERCCFYNVLSAHNRILSKGANVSGQMIGIILWSDSTDQKAVIWCEDHGDLAFLSSPDEVHLPDTFFAVGDLVEFEVSTRQNMRLARNPSRIGHSWGATLAQNLQAGTAASAAVTTPDVPETEAKIIPFRLGATSACTRTIPPSRPGQRRRG